MDAPSTEPTDTITHYELSCLRIEDNGEGPNEPVDRASFVLHATSPTMPGTCQTVTPPAAATFDVERGTSRCVPKGEAPGRAPRRAPRPGARSWR